MTFLRTILVFIFTTTYVVAQNTAGQFGSLAEDSSQPIEAQADKMEIDEVTGQIQMSGAVEIIQGLTKLTAAFVRIEYTEDQSDIETIYASGSVYLESSGDVAKGDEATYQLSENMIYLNGNVKANTRVRSTCLNRSNRHRFVVCRRSKTNRSFDRCLLLRLTWC